MRVLVAVKRCVDYAAKIRVKADGSGVETSAVKVSRADKAGRRERVSVPPRAPLAPRRTPACRAHAAESRLVIGMLSL